MQVFETVFITIQLAKNIVDVTILGELRSVLKNSQNLPSKTIICFWKWWQKRKLQNYLLCSRLGLRRRSLQAKKSQISGRRLIQSLLVNKNVMNKTVNISDYNIGTAFIFRDPIKRLTLYLHFLFTQPSNFFQVCKPKTSWHTFFQLKKESSCFGLYEFKKMTKCMCLLRSIVNKEAFQILSKTLQKAVMFYIANILLFLYP